MIYYYFERLNEPQNMQPEEINVEQVYQQAIQAYQSGQLDTSEKNLRDLLAAMPQQDGIMSTLGGVLLAGGKLDESIQMLERAIQINNQNVDAYLNLGIAQQHKGASDEAIRLMQHAAQLAPERHDIQFNLANALIQTGHFEKAIHILEHLIEQQPNFLQAYHTLAAVYGFTQNTDALIQCYQKAKEQFPNDLNTIILLGNALMDSGQTEPALANYLEAKEKYPEHFLPYAILGKFHLDVGDQVQGEQALLHAAKLNPNDLNTNILLGNLNNTLGKEAEAIKYYQQALVIKPNDPGALSNLRRIYSKKIPYWHFEMLADTQRNDAYQKAIEKAVTKDSVVLDIGTGSGLLAMMAARAGAQKVVACEVHQQLAAVAEVITQQNGYGQQIKVIPKQSTQLIPGEDLPEKANLIISEILDVGALGEGMLPSIRHAVQNLAHPNVRLIPSGVKLFGQLIEIPSRSLVAPIRTISGFDLSTFEQFRIPNEYLKINLKAEKYKELSPVFPLMDIDCYQLPPAYPDDQARPTLIQTSIKATGMVQAVVFWFDLYLDEEIMVSSRPNGPLEHWGQALFCFEHPVSVQVGQDFKFTMLQSDQIIKFELKH